MGRKDEILLSPKHGLNPCIVMCAWCGNETGDIALLGKLPGDARAPARATHGYEPCEKCKAEWAKGILIFEASDYPVRDGQPSLNDYYPTGQWMVVRESFIHWLAERARINVQRILAVRRLGVTREVFAQFVQIIQAAEAKEAASHEGESEGNGCHSGGD